jgi:elongation factor Ts
VIATINADKNKGILVVLGCETDFVSKNAEFQALSQKIANAALVAFPANLSDLLQVKIEGASIEELVTQQTAKTGEKHQIVYYDTLEAPYLSIYNHSNSKVSSLVAFSKVIDELAAKDVSMQVTAMAPVAVSKEECSQEMQEKELQIGREQARLDNKPENMIEIIAQGKLKKFFKESTLLSQDFIKDSKITVENYLKSIDASVTILAFKRFSLND